MDKLMVIVRSTAFAVIFYGVSVFYVLTAFVLSHISLPGMAAVARNWGWYHRWCTRWLLGVRVKVEGQFRNEPLFYVFKHESFFEAIQLLTLFHQPVVIAKKQLTNIPLWGRIARRHGAIFIDRAGGATALREMVKAARAMSAAEGRPVIIFPEGTRANRGKRPPLQSGFAGLYKLLGLPLVPVAVNSGRCFPRDTMKAYPGVITFRIGETIPPGLDRAEVEERVIEAINVLNPIDEDTPAQA